MKAVIQSGNGGPQVLQLGEAADPEPGPGQLLVKVRATALNRADTMQRKGMYPPPKGESEILGLELAGEVEAWGDGVEGFSKGQGVFGLVGGGGYAQYALIDKDMAMPIPDGWSFAEAAAVPEVYFTANETVFVLGNLQPGEAVLIHAGGSGVGTAAIQMAHHIGAKVYFTAGSQDKIERATALGADAGINYKTHDFAEEINRLTGGEGVDVVEDFLGASYLSRNLSVLRPGGRLILVALMGGAKCEVDLSTVMRNRLQVFGSVMRSRSLEDKRAITARFQQRWLPPLIEGKIKPVIDSVFPLEEVVAAHEAMEANKNFGKIILSVD
ncbi:MAG: NAD(P)H-quinone oxidoreductase [SAR324 cluster bacterium]|nr:NAD(P)H-quinone oxidoreductase [SAR324 cluster bacterium]MCZ6628347.1 NAD(P)H-quinone oxidoreductase [SAR324 cluster bacterium]